MCTHEAPKSSRNSFKVLRTFQVELEFRSVGFCGGRKTGVPGEKPSEQETRTNNKLNPHMTPSSGIEPGPHWWEASALTTEPSLLPSPAIQLVYHNERSYNQLVLVGTWWLGGCYQIILYLRLLLRNRGTFREILRARVIFNRTTEN